LQYKLYVAQDWPKTIFSKRLQIIVNYIVYLLFVLQMTAASPSQCHSCLHQWTRP